MVCHPPVPSSSLGYLFGLLGARSTPSYWPRRVGQPNMECCYSFDVSGTFTFNWPRSAVALSSSCFGDGYWEAYTTSSCIIYELGCSRTQGRIISWWKRGRETNSVICTIVDNSYPWAFSCIHNADVHCLNPSLFWKDSLVFTWNYQGRGSTYPSHASWVLETVTSG